MCGSKGKIILLFFSMVLLLSGCSILVYPYANGLWKDYTMQQEAEEFKLMLEDPEGNATSHVIVHQPEEETVTAPAVHTELWLDMKAYNEAIFAEGQEGLANQTAYEIPSFTLADYGLGSEVFGVVCIPRLEVELPIYLGATKQHMADGAAHMSNTSLPIGGENTNCVLAGHRGWNGADYFLYIDFLVPGDVVTLTTIWETITYTVVETKIIQPNEVEAIHIQPSRELLTLLTCHPPASGGKQRYLVICERINDENGGIN